MAKERSGWMLVMAMVVAGFAVLWAGVPGKCVAAANGKTANGQSGDVSGAPYTIEYGYKVKWGHAEEFLALFKKNHLLVLRKEMEMGRILKVTMVTPQYHATEEGRWDYRVTIVFKNAAIANDNFDSSTIAKQLYADQETFKKEEQRRFEILEGHWDVPLKEVDLGAK